MFFPALLYSATMTTNHNYIKFALSHARGTLSFYLLGTVAQTTDSFAYLVFLLVPSGDTG